MNKLPQKLPKVDMFFYVSLNNAVGTKQLAKNEEYPQMPRDPFEGAMVLADIVNKEGPKGLNKIAMIHPDRDLILNSIKQETINADAGTNDEKESKSLSEKTMNLIIVSSAIVLGITLISIIATK
jgi:hypothetical protein